jgi:glycosyltransferase involved in cell wall biosynthesis
MPLPLGPQDLFISNLANVKRLRWAGWKTTRRHLDPNQNDQFLITAVPWMLVRRLGFRLAEHLGFGVLTFPNIKAMSKPDILIVDHPRQFWLVNVLKPKLLLYRPTDAYSFPGHKDDNIYRKIESWLLQQSDGVVLTASETAVRMLSLCDGFQPPPMRVLENGVDLEAFVNNLALPPPTLKQLPHPRLLYIGTFDDRIDYGFITAAARQLPDYSFVLGGPMTPIQQAKFGSCNNVILLGGIAYAELSRYIEHCDVGFMPMNDHPFNVTRSPMKLYEFAACGLPMVAKATPELKRRSLPFCFMYDSLSEFRTAIDQALAYKLTGTDEMRRLAKERSWNSIAFRLLAFCDEIRLDRSDD